MSKATLSQCHVHFRLSTVNLYMCTVYQYVAPAERAARKVLSSGTSKATGPQSEVRQWSRVRSVSPYVDINETHKNMVFWTVSFKVPIGKGNNM